MVSGQADLIAHFHVDLAVFLAAFVVRYGDHIVAVLASVVVDVVERFEAPGSVWKPGLHQLVGQSAHLGRKSAHQIVAFGQKVYVKNDSLGRFGRVALVN